MLYASPICIDSWVVYKRALHPGSATDRGFLTTDDQIETICGIVDFPQTGDSTPFKAGGWKQCWEMGDLTRISAKHHVNDWHAVGYITCGCISKKG